MALELYEDVRTGRSAVVHCNGRIDYRTCEPFEQRINELLHDGCYRIAIDLSRVEYISSSGAGVIIAAVTTAREHDGDIVLVNPGPGVSVLLSLLGITKLMRIVDTLEETMEFLES